MQPFLNWNCILLCAPNYKAEYSHCKRGKSNDNFYVKYLWAIGCDRYVQYGGQLLSDMHMCKTSITAWYADYTENHKKFLKRVIRTAERHNWTPSLDVLFMTRCLCKQYCSGQNTFWELIQFYRAPGCKTVLFAQYHYKTELHLSWSLPLPRTSAVF